MAEQAWKESWEEIENIHFWENMRSEIIGSGSTFTSAPLGHLSESCSTITVSTKCSSKQELSRLPPSLTAFLKPAGCCAHMQKCACSVETTAKAYTEKPSWRREQAWCAFLIIYTPGLGCSSGFEKAVVFPTFHIVNFDLYFVGTHVAQHCSGKEKATNCTVCLAGAFMPSDNYREQCFGCGNCRSSKLFLYMWLLWKILMCLNF